jgi:hypothetical protein
VFLLARRANLRGPEPNVVSVVVPARSEAFRRATSDIVMVPDADLTAPPEDLPKSCKVSLPGTCAAPYGPIRGAATEIRMNAHHIHRGSSALCGYAVFESPEV